MSCAGCEKPILDKFLMHVLERAWHAACVRCADCRAPLADKCYSRDNKLFCRNDFFRRYGTKCSGCGHGISPSDLVRKAREKVFHLNCFTCLVCRKQLSTGEELYVLDDNKFICKDDYLAGKTPALHHCSEPLRCKQQAHYDQVAEEARREFAFSANPFAPAPPATRSRQPHERRNPELHTRDTHDRSKCDTDSLLGSGSEDEDEEERGGGAAGASPGGAPAGAHAPLAHPDLAPTLNGDSKPGQDDSEDQGSLDGDTETRDSQAENKSPDDGNGGSKRRGPRTTIKAKQLEILKSAFSQTPKPTRHIREQLAKETGLPMRVIQSDGGTETGDSQAENKSPDEGNGGGPKRRGPRTTVKAEQLEILKLAFGQTPKPTRLMREQLAKETGLPMRFIQVWFQNKRSKERRLKQLTSMGRGPFFGSSRKMRGFPMNLSPGGLEDGPPFPYFATADGKFEFGYGGPPFHPHDGPFFPGHHPPGPMPFNQPGMEGGMGGGGEFPEQFAPPPDHLLLPRPGSPEFSFGEPAPPLHPEGLVW